MTLKAVISQADYDGLSDDLKKEYLKKSGEHFREGMFYLDVARVEGFGLEPIDGLKTALARERQNAEEAGYKLKAFDGLNATEARDALKKLGEYESANPKEKLEAIVEDRVKQWQDKNASDLAVKDSEIKVLMDALEEETIVSKAISALNKLNGNADLLLPHVLARTRVVRTEADGKVRFAPRVIEPNSGQDLLSKKSGSTDFMDIEELVATMKENKTFAAGFTDVNASGFGSERGDGETKQIAGKKTIKASDQDALNANVDGIANGSVIVVD
jgi:hypothetical protein